MTTPPRDPHTGHPGGTGSLAGPRRTRGLLACASESLRLSGGKDFQVEETHSVGDRCGGQEAGKPVADGEIRSLREA